MGYCPTGGHTTVRPTRAFQNAAWCVPQGAKAPRNVSSQTTVSPTRLAGFLAEPRVAEHSGQSRRPNRTNKNLCLVPAARASPMSRMAVMSFVRRTNCSIRIGFSVVVDTTMSIFNFRIQSGVATWKFSESRTRAAMDGEDVRRPSSAFSSKIPTFDSVLDILRRHQITVAAKLPSLLVFSES